MISTSSSILRRKSIIICRVLSADSSKSTFSDHETIGQRAIMAKILESSVPFINEFGFSRTTLSAGAEKCNLPGTIHGIFEDPGSSLAFYMIRKFNRQLREEMIKNPKNDQKTVGFIHRNLKFRLQMVIPYLEKWPEAMMLLAKPVNIPAASSYLLKMCDDLWYHAGDRSVDMSWYTKRVPMMGVFASSQLHLLQDKSQDFEETWEFMARRLEDVKIAGGALNQVQNALNMGSSIAYSAYKTAANVIGIDALRT